MKYLLAAAAVLAIGSVAAFAATKVTDSDSPAIPSGQSEEDITSVTSSTAPGPALPGGTGKNDTIITIKVCLKTCPNSKTTSYIVNIGGKKIRITPTPFQTWQLRLWGQGAWGNFPLPSGQSDPKFTLENYTEIPPTGGSGTSVSECCIQIQFLASALGLPSPNGNVGVSVTSHGNTSGTGTATDTAPGGTIRYTG